MAIVIDAKFVPLVTFFKKDAFSLSIDNKQVFNKSIKVCTRDPMPLKKNELSPISITNSSKYLLKSSVFYVPHTRTLDQPESYRKEFYRQAVDIIKTGGALSVNALSSKEGFSLSNLQEARYAIDAYNYNLNIFDVKS